MQRTVELVPNGAEIPVTNSNRIEYIYLTSNYRLNKQVEKQSSAFFAGLSEIIPARSLKMFNQDELRMLVGTLPLLPYSSTRCRIDKSSFQGV